MSQLLNWIGENEAVLSGIAAAIAMVPSPLPARVVSPAPLSGAEPL